MGRSLFKYFKPILIGISFFFKMLPMFITSFIWHLVMPFNGFISKSIRYCILKAKSKAVGDNLSIGCNTIVKKMYNFSCGDNVSIHENCVIDCDGGVKIGDNVSIAHNSSLVSANHEWNDMKIPIKYNKMTKLGIVVFNDVWIGCGVRVLDGVSIEERCVIAAGAIVNKSIKSGFLVGGIPAKIIKKII